MQILFNLKSLVMFSLTINDLLSVFCFQVFAFASSCCPLVFSGQDYDFTNMSLNVEGLH